MDSEVTGLEAWLADGLRGLFLFEGTELCLVVNPVNLFELRIFGFFGEYK